MKRTTLHRQKGAVSLFIVIFAALLIVIVTVSFVRIMIQNQQQATSADLSQSALDSAQAGVEDGKRALLRYQTMCNGGDTNCITDSKINSPICNEAVLKLTDVAPKESNNEVAVNTIGDGGTLNQYYTCVLINTDTVDYPGYLLKDKSVIIPLKVKAVDAFDTVHLQWSNSSDIGSNTVKLDPTGTTPLLSVSSWALNTPSIMRTQLIQFGSIGFKLNDFNDTDASGNSNANTLFLYPSSVGLNNANFATRDVRRDVNPASPGSPVTVKCSSNVVSGGYACTTDLKLPTPIKGGDRTAYLRLTSLYNGANYRVTLLSGGSGVNFNGVLPSIDSTGRADNKFRRVQTRVKLNDDTFPYPEAAIDITGNLCKDFTITDSAAPGGGYDPGSCEP